MQPSDNREQLLDAWLALMEDAPSPEGTINLPVLSGSMVPEIPVGAMALIEKSEVRRCRTGHIVVYRDNERLVIHRLLWRLGWGTSFLVFEKGDANDLGRWIRGNQIKGKVVAVDLLAGEGPQPCPLDSDRARISLSADFRHRILAFPRRIKRLLLGGGN